MKNESKILITGSSGMVGKNLVEELKFRGYTNLIEIDSKIIDLKDRKKVFNFFKKEKPEYVFHLASKVGGISANIESPVDFLRDNLLINTNVIDASYQYKVKKLLNLGSSCIYPKKNRQPMREIDLMTGKLEPTNEGYALSKICALKLCQYYNQQYGTNFISIMPPNVYGVHEKFDLNKSHVISSLIMKFDNAKNNNEKEVMIWGSGNARREFLYVKDLAEIIIFSMNNIEKDDLIENCFINTGSFYDISIKELAIMIKEIVGFKGDIKFDISKPEGMNKKLLDSSEFKKFGVTPKINLHEGISKTYKYYIETR